MTHDDPAGDGGPPGRRRRPAPTIDLTATEVAREPAPKDEPAPAEQAAAPETPAPEAPSPETPASDTPPPEEPAAAAPEADEPAPKPPRAAWLPPDLPWRAFGAGAAGGAGVALVLLLLVWFGLPRGGDPAAALDPRLAAVEARLQELVQELAARPAPPPAADPKAVEALAARLRKLETAPPPAAASAPAADPALAGRIGALERQAKTLADNLAALGRRADTSAAALGQLQDVARTSSADHSQVETLNNRVAALEKTDRALAEELATRAAAATADRTVRVAIAAAALRSSVERGEPFAAELAAARPLLDDPGALAPLEPFAASGVPSAAALGRELAVLVPAMFKLAGSPSRDGGFIDRLQANAEKLVRVRPVDDTPGDSPAAILARVEIRAAHADIAAANAELAKLPERVKAPAKGWIAKAEARARALDASRRLAAESVAALKP